MSPRSARIARALLVALGLVVTLALALVWPLVARGLDVWQSAVWVRPWWLLAGLAAPVCVWATTLGADARVPRLAMPAIAPIVLGPRGVRAYLRDAPGVLRGAAIALAVLALARPQNVLRAAENEERGIDIVLVLDLSGSMKAVMDASGTDVVPLGAVRGRRPTRLDVAKDVIVDFVSRRKTDRIGVVVFGKEAYVLCPPTLDYSLLIGMVRQMRLEVIDGSATAIGDAVGTAVARLRRSDAKSKAVVLLTDGESNAGAVDPVYATHLAQAQGDRIYTVQIGNGDDVDVEVNVDLFGQPVYEKTHFPVNQELLHKMAQETGGEAFVANDRKALELSMHRILDSLERTRFVAQAAAMEDLFPFLIVPAALLMLLEALVRIALVRRFP